MQEEQGRHSQTPPGRQNLCTSSGHFLLGTISISPCIRRKGCFCCNCRCPHCNV